MYSSYLFSVIFPKFIKTESKDICMYKCLNDLVQTFMYAKEVHHVNIKVRIPINSLLSMIL